MDTSSLSIEGIESGESINRDTAFELGKDMLSREKWFIGYGWGIYGNNRVAWFGSADQLRADPHSLFYSLPMLLGWFGSFAFLLLLIVPVAITFIRLGIRGAFDTDTREIGRTFGVVSFLFLVNQLKQSFVVSQNYSFVILMWLALGISIQSYRLSDR